MKPARPPTLNTSSPKTLSFPTQSLASPDFTPQTFIAHHRSQIPLRLLRDDLRQHLTFLQTQLVQTVQTNFSTFTTFSTSIAEADALADVARKPLQNLQALLQTLLQALDQQINQLEQSLAKRREFAERTNALKGLLEANDLLQKCERLLREYSPLAAVQSQGALRLVERIAGEAAKLSFVLRRAVGGAFLSSLSVRINAVRRGVRNCLENWLRRALFPKDQADDSVYDNETLGRVLAMYVVSDLSEEAEDFFKRHIVMPFTGTRVRMTPMLAAAERKVGATVTAADALIQAEEEVVAFLGDKVMPLISLVESEERLRGKLDFVGRAVWPQIEHAVSQHMAASFSPGIPDVFHKSVLAGGRLYRAVESAVGEERRDQLNKSKATVEFWKHWNLPVYFQLRFQEVTSKFDAFLEKGPAMVDDGAEEGEKGGLLRSDVYHAAPTASLVASLRRCWSDDVFLISLTHRFLRLSLQLLARYATWVRTGLAGEWTNPDAIPKGAVRVFYDITVLQKRIPAELSSVLRLRAPSFSAEVLENLDTAFVEATDRFSALLPELSRSISDALARSCVENLQPLRGILATYRMSTKQAPTTHSPFVPKILRPLKVFLKENEGIIEQDKCVKIAAAVTEQTAAEYFNMATDLMQRNKSSEATLRRLNIGRSGTLGGSSGGTMSVIDKISMQLYLDVAKFMDDIKGLGVATAGVPSLVQLWDSVKREDTSEKDKDVDFVEESAESRALDLPSSHISEKDDSTHGATVSNMS